MGGEFETAYLATNEVHGKKYISRNAKMIHYKTTMKNTALYASETVTPGKQAAEQLEKEKQKILRKILGCVRWERKSRDELYWNHERNQIQKRKIYRRYDQDVDGQNNPKN